MQAEVIRGDPVPIAKHPVQLSPDEGFAKQRAQAPEWKGVLDFVFQMALARPVGHHTMAVAPLSERSFGLYIAELSTLFEVAMLGHPTTPESANTHCQNELSSIFDAAPAFE
jgi:hypothetical protein